MDDENSGNFIYIVNISCVICIISLSQDACQKLERKSYLDVISQTTSVTRAFSNNNDRISRNFNESLVGFLCPYNTPDNTDIGHKNNFVIGSRITISIPKGKIHEI